MDIRILRECYLWAGHTKACTEQALHYAEKGNLLSALSMLGTAEHNLARIRQQIEQCVNAPEGYTLSADATHREHQINILARKGTPAR